MGHDEHAVAFDESARDNRENDAESGGPAAASKRRLGRGHRRVRYPLRRVAAQFNLHKTGQVALPIIEKLAELLGQLRGR